MRYEYRSNKRFRLPGKTMLSMLGASVLGVATAAAEPPTHVLSECRLPQITQPARCGTLDVPEHPDRPHGRRLSIHVVVIPATAESALPDPIVPLMGGPGEDAIGAAAYYAAQFESLRRDRDLVLIDQRGTGRSNALRCDLHSPDDPTANLRDFFPPAAVERCARRLRTQADLTQYGYARFADDLEHVRRTLGYGPLNLFAGSYGTRAAQVYLRAHPGSVRTAYLGSVVPTDVAQPLPMAKALESVLEGTFAACATNDACREAFPDLREEFRQILTRLDSGEIRVRVPGRDATVRLHRGRVVEWLRAKLYRAEGAAAVPWLIHQAHLGHWQPIAEGIASHAEALDAAISSGLFFAIVCSEDVPFLREKDIVAATRGTFLGDYRVRQQQAACASWPKAKLPAGYRTPVRSSVPTLFVSGDSDPATPLWLSEHVASGFSNRLEVVMRGRGHTEWNDCVGRLYRDFVRNGSVRGLDANACPPEPRPPFKTR